LIFAAIGILLTACTASAAEGKFVIVAISSVSLEELTAPGLPNISYLIDKGGIGVMNTRPASVRGLSEDIVVTKYSMEGACATIGAGTRTAATTDARKAYNASDIVDNRPVRQLYESLYGQSSRRAEVLHLGMNRIWFINSEAKYKIEPGALGTALRSAGLKTAAVGNSDTHFDPRREATIIAADAVGIIDYGYVGSKLVMRDPEAPYGIRTNSEVLLASYRKAIKNADFMVVDVGDTARAANYARHCIEEQGLRLRRTAIENADYIIGEILKDLDLSKDRIAVVSTNPSAQMIDEHNFLPPIIMAGSGIGQGLLTSGSTRRSGIVTNTDIAASVVDFFGIEAPNSFIGSPVKTTIGTKQDLLQTNQRIILQVQRQPAMRGIAGFLIFYVIVMSFWILQQRNRPAPIAKWLVLLPIALFLSVLWLPAVANLEMTGSIIMLGLMVFVILVSAWFILRSPGKAFGWLCGAVILTVIADMMRGAVLLRDSIMSYSPVDGARYYGIGNEHMGSAISAGVIAAGFLAAVLAERRTLRIISLTALLGLVIVTIGPLGSNAGGAISIAAAVSTGLVLWSGHKIHRKHIILGIASVLIMIGILIGLDQLRPGAAQSHVGRAVHLITTDGFNQALTIIDRKLSMNLMLLKNSAWSKLLITSVAAVIVLLSSRHLNPIGQLRENRHIQAGIIAATIGSIAALIFNDSGVVAAATAFIYIWTAVTLAAMTSSAKLENGERESSLPSPTRASEACPAESAGQS